MNSNYLGKILFSLFRIFLLFFFLLMEKSIWKIRSFIASNE